MRETGKMVSVKVVLINVLYQPAKFYTTFLDNLCIRPWLFQKTSGVKIKAIDHSFDMT